MRNRNAAKAGSAKNGDAFRTLMTPQPNTYLDIAFKQVEEANQRSTLEALSKEVHQHGQAFAFDQRFTGSLISGDKSDLGNFENRFNFSDQFWPILLYHFLGPLGAILSIKRWGVDFTTAMGISPCYMKGSCCNAGFLLYYFTPPLVVASYLFQLFVLTGPFSKSRFFMVYFVPQIILAGVWSFRLVMIAAKYAFVSKFRFQQFVASCSNEDTNEDTMEQWVGWHLYAWITHFDSHSLLDVELEDTALQVGRSVNDPNYTFLYTNCFKDKEDALSFCKRINRHLQSSHNSSGELPGVASICDVTLEDSKKQGMSNYLLRSVVDELKDSSNGKIDPTVGVEVNGPRLIKQVFLQATDELAHAKKTRSCMAKCCVSSIFNSTAMAWMFTIAPMIASILFADASSIEFVLSGNESKPLLSCYFTDNDEYVAESNHVAYQRALKSIGCADPRQCLTARFVEVYMCGSRDIYLRLVHILFAVTCAIFSVQTAKVVFRFFEYGRDSYRRQFYAIRRLNALVATQISISDNEACPGNLGGHLPNISNLPAAIDIRSRSRSYAYFLNYDLLRNMGSMYAYRIQLLIVVMLQGLLVMTVVSVLRLFALIGSEQLVIAEDEYVDAMFEVNFIDSLSILARRLFGDFALMLIASIIVLYFVISMVVSGGDTNSQVTRCNRILLEQQLDLYELAGRDCGSHIANMKTEESKTAVSRHMLREYYFHAAKGMNDTRLIMGASLKRNPVTFLYLTAGPALYRVIISQLLLVIIILFQNQILG